MRRYGMSRWERFHESMVHYILEVGDLDADGRRKAFARLFRAMDAYRKAQKPRR